MGDNASDSENSFLTKEDLIAHLKGSMFPKGKSFAPSLVMWGDSHGEEVDVDRLDHMSPPEEESDA